MFGPEEAMHYMRNGSALDRNSYQMLFRLFNRLGNGNRHFSRLPFPDSHVTLSIPYHHESAKVEPFSTFDDLGDTVDEHHLVFKTQFFGIDSHSAVLL